MKTTPNKMSQLPSSLNSSLSALLLSVASGFWLPACGDDDVAPAPDAVDASDAASTAAPDATAPTDATESSDTSSVPTKHESAPTLNDAGDAADAADASRETDAGAPTTSGATETSDTEEKSGATETSDTEETSSATETSDTEETGESTGETSSEMTNTGADGGADAGDAATWDAAPDADTEPMPWDADAFDIGRDETRVLADFDTDGDQSNGLAIIAPDVGFFGPPATVEDLLFEIADSIGSFTIPFTGPAQALRMQFPLSGNYATHELRVRLRVVAALPNNPGANPTLQLFSYSGGGMWNSLGLPIDLGVWHEYSYDLWTQPVVPDQLNSVGFRVSTGNTLEMPDSFLVEVDWVRLEPRR